MIFFSRLEFVPAQINGQKNTIAARDRSLWVGCTAVLLYCCTEIPVRCRQIQYVLHLSTPHLRTWYGSFFSLCPWRLKSSLTEDGRGPLAPARPEPLYQVLLHIIFFVLLRTHHVVSVAHIKLFTLNYFGRACKWTTIEKKTGRCSVNFPT